jgi:acetoacetyl-CoA synthetase
VGRYLEELRRTRGLDFEDYDALWTWSVTDLEDFLELGLGLAGGRGPDSAPRGPSPTGGARAKWYFRARRSTTPSTRSAARAAESDRPAILARSQTRIADVT